ncbi:hypothetical protein ACIA8H_32110 [Streptomyces goshikiensis]|uniref:hypothetical protein n=1 Tax=Streptomyces goshikiensis TaxID=1942 RepID=UPI0037BCAC15
MPTIVVGFRLSNPVTSRQITVIVTESGVLHRSHGQYARPPKLNRPKAPVPLPSMAAGRAHADLRDLRGSAHGVGVLS